MTKSLQQHASPSLWHWIEWIEVAGNFKSHQFSLAVAGFERDTHPIENKTQPVRLQPLGGGEGFQGEAGRASRA